jgi:hypothetical protein
MIGSQAGANGNTHTGYLYIARSEAEYSNA